MNIRKARIDDVKKIQQIINIFAAQGAMLSRSLNELYENLRDFWVAEEQGKVVGCCALHVCWQELVEIKSLAVERPFQHKGIGRRLVEVCLCEARELGAKTVFALTYRPDFFKKMGFRRISHARLPHKVWAECINCPKFPDCGEIAMIKKI